MNEVGRVEGLAFVMDLIMQVRAAAAAGVTAIAQQCSLPYVLAWFDDDAAQVGETG